MTTTPTLPATIPGLLRYVSPLLGLAGRTVALGPVYDGRWVPVHRGDHLAAALALDLSDPTGRAHAAWWLALRECPAPYVLDPAAVAWHPAPAQADLGWALRWQARDQSGAGSLTGGWWTGADRSPIPRRVLRHLRRDDDPRLLPDGSRWVDAEALRLVCLHVAGVTP